jgi:hypothetical protein
MASFLVRVWEPADLGGHGDGLRGVVRHVASGTEATFASEAELLAYLRAGVTDPGAPGQDEADPRADGRR